MFEFNEIQKASEIFAALLSSRSISINQNKEFFENYNEDNVRKILEVFTDSINCSIGKINDALYLLPKTDCFEFGYTRQELKKALVGRTDVKNEEFYLALFMVLVLFSEFFSGQGAYLKTRMFISKSEFQEILSNKLEKYETGILEEVFENTKLPMSIISNYWKSLILEDSSKATRTKFWYIERVLEFLQKESLVKVMDLTDIYPTKEMEDIVSSKMLDIDRAKEISEAIDSENLLNID